MFTPFGTLSFNQTAAWHPEPRERGTFSILSSCLTTLVLCVWTAVHLNIPKTGKEHLQKYRKAGWLVLGLLAPELVAWNAWEQYRKASRITQKVYQTYPRTPTSTWYRRAWQYLTQALRFRIPLDPVIDQEMSLESASSPPLRHLCWTLTHGFYAAMGGFAIRAEGLDLDHPEETTTLALDEAGLFHLLDNLPGILPDLPESEILDKSKASTLAKSIHVALMNLFSGQEDALPPPPTWPDLESHGPLGVSISGCLTSFNHPRLDHNSIADHDECLYENIQRRIRFGTTLSSIISDIHCSGIHCSGKSEDVDSFNLSLSIKIHQFWITYSYCIKNWARPAPLATHRFVFDITPAMQERLKQAAETGPVSINEVHSEFYSIDRIKNWSLSPNILYMAATFREVPILPVLTIVEILYGGLHLLAWNAPFNTNIERIMWQISGIAIASVGPLFPILYQAWHHGRFNPFKLYHSGRPLTAHRKKLEAFIFDCYAPLYLLARLYLVVECFVDLPYLPDSAFTTPNFTLYIPHFA
ncbi:hypothetical protein D6D01_01340 [Aureobasidium pullulans]|uniref:Uncharacterized protein n=1 Tax=Aureobasidium pullulans TaxID=5580 RepID=A0A4S9LZC9_AURPU|nr:hypothetical protein D6D01_01340 [Aureobasidium pullulans]